MAASSSQVVAIYTTKATSSDICQQLGVLCIPDVAASASELRQQLTSSIAFLAGPNGICYVFLTLHGWEIIHSMEDSVRIKSLIGEDMIIRIRFKSDRVGITYNGNPIGFVLLKPTTVLSLSSLRSLIQAQHSSTIITEAQFVDVNGWPVSLEQEQELHMFDVLRSNTIHFVKLVDITKAIMQIQTGGVAQKTTIVSSFDEAENTCLISPNISRRSPNPLAPLEIFVSYVQKETSVHAQHLRDKLASLGYTVFLDKQCIKPGDDWHDSLNEAICNCNLFVPLVSSLYGLTEWTNREVKLADTLTKFIIPINFMPTWPPMCLAIQFATTQYIEASIPNDQFVKQIDELAAKISEQYKLMQKSITNVDEEEFKKFEENVLASTCKRNSFKNVVRTSLFKQSSLVVISHHPDQLELVQEIRNLLESKGYEMWSSMAGENLEKRETFKSKVNTAALVVFVLSQEYTDSPSCKQELYYCEGRKKILAVVSSTFQIPGWLTTLVAPDAFIDSHSDNFQDVFMEEVECATVPAKAEVRLRKLVEQRTQLHRMCSDLKKHLPKGRLVYVTGSTKFSSKYGRSICEEFGALLAKETDCYLVTGGFHGVGDAIGRSFHKERQKLNLPEGVIHIQAITDAQDYSTQTLQHSNGSFQPLPYGKTLFYCNSVRQREMLVPKVIRLCILIEGGPAAAFEAHQFSWSDHIVVPVKSTGGTAGGKFNAPPGIFSKPDFAKESDWSILSDIDANPLDVATALVNIVKCYKLD